MSTATLEAPTPMAATESRPLMEDLILVRLLVPGKKIAQGALRKSLNRLFENPPEAEQWSATIDRLREAGFLDPEKLLLSAAGQARALAFLGIDALPPKTTWRNLPGKFLVPIALGLKSTGEIQKRLSKADDLAAFLLKRELGLAVGQTFSQVMTAIACRELKIPETADWGVVRQEVLSRMVGSEERLKDDQIKQLILRQKLNVPKNSAGPLRKAVFNSWTNESSSRQSTSQPAAPGPDRAAEPFDLPAFANTVLVAARHCSTGRFGDNKVFINHVWRSLQTEPGFPKLDLSEFKHRLVEANNANLLTLNRADMAPDMPAADVQESETHYLNAQFHFVLLEEARS